MTSETLECLLRCFQDEGIVFFGPPDAEGPGVQLMWDPVREPTPTR